MSPICRAPLCNSGGEYHISPPLAQQRALDRHLEHYVTLPSFLPSLPDKTKQNAVLWQKTDKGSKNLSPVKETHAGLSQP